MLFLDAGKGQLTAAFDPHQPFTPIDLEDLAEVAAAVVLDDGHAFATYELAGADRIDLAGMASVIGQVLGRSVSVVRVPAAEVASGGRAPADIQAMLDHYDQHGLVGNANVLRMLLGREPTPFARVIRRELAG